jgi:hypothetical protein
MQILLSVPKKNLGRKIVVLFPTSTIQMLLKRTYDLEKLWEVQYRSVLPAGVVNWWSPVAEGVVGGSLTGFAAAVVVETSSPNTSNAINT